MQELQSIKEKIINADFSSAFESLTSFLSENSPFFDNIIILKLNYELLISEKLKGTISGDEYYLRLNKITANILVLCSKLEQSEKGNNKVNTEKKLSDKELLNYYYNETFLEDNVGISGSHLLPQVLLVSPVNLKKTNAVHAIKILVDPNFPEYYIKSELNSKALALLNYHLENRNGKEFYNATTTRLNKVFFSEKELIILIAKTSYFSYLSTNYSMDITLEGWSESLRNRLHRNGRICRLEESLLSNHIGVGVLVFTSDNFLVLQKRPINKVSIRGGELAPSISGASEFKDFSINEENKLMNFFLREAEEELGLDKDCFILNSIKLLGIVRELLRGGKPEIFFSAVLKIDYASVLNRSEYVKDKWESGKITGVEFPSSIVITNPKSYQSEIDKILRRIKEEYKNLSLPLITNLLLYREIEN